MSDLFVQRTVSSGPGAVAAHLAGPAPGLPAHVPVSKSADHLPLYRQSQIFDRKGLDPDRSTLADWVGTTTALLAPPLTSSGGCPVR